MAGRAHAVDQHLREALVPVWSPVDRAPAAGENVGEAEATGEDGEENMDVERPAPAQTAAAGAGEGEVLEEGEVAAPVAAPEAAAPVAAEPAAALSEASAPRQPTPKRPAEGMDESLVALMPPTASPRAEHAADQEIAEQGSQYDQELCNIEQSLC